MAHFMSDMSMWTPSHLGITIDKWGPSAWNTLHAFAHRVPVTSSADQQRAFRDFLYGFAKHLPCPHCRTHFLRYLDAHLTAHSLASRAATIAFLNDAHNDVNVRLGKPVWSIEAHMAAYSPAMQAHRRDLLHNGMLFVAVAIAGLVLHRMQFEKNRLPYKHTHSPCPRRVDLASCPPPQPEGGFRSDHSHPRMW